MSTQGAHFSRFFGKIKTSLETFVFFMLPCVRVFLCFFGACSVTSRPRSKHSSFSCEKNECFERGLEFTENLEKSRPRSKHSSFSCSRAPFWPYLGLILAPSWPLLGSSWPHLGPSWPHLGPILGLLLALLAGLGALLASSWPCLGRLSCTWPHLGPWVSWVSWAPCWPTGAPS